MKDDYEIIQIIPADNWYARYKDDQGYFYNKVTCIALVKIKDEDGGFYQDIKYLTLDATGTWEFEDNVDGYFYSPHDMESFPTSKSQYATYTKDLPG